MSKKPHQQIAKDITEAAQNSGMKAQPLFDSVVELLSHTLIAAVSDDDRPAAPQKAHDVIARAGEAGISEQQFNALAQSITTALSHDYSDLLGDVAATLGTLSKDGGQFFTPRDISSAATSLCVADSEQITARIKSEGHVSVHEPAAGSGGLVLRFAELVRDVGYQPGSAMYADCVELEPSAFYMCHVQLAMRDIPACIRLGNTLTRSFQREVFTPVYYRMFVPVQRERRLYAELFTNSTDPGRGSETEAA